MPNVECGISRPRVTSIGSVSWTAKETLRFSIAFYWNIIFKCWNCGKCWSVEEFSNTLRKNYCWTTKRVRYNIIFDYIYGAFSQKFSCFNQTSSNNYDNFFRNSYSLAVLVFETYLCKVRDLVNFSLGSDRRKREASASWQRRMSSHAWSEPLIF